MNHIQTKAAALTQGIMIFVYLAVLTGLEFFVAVAMQSVPLLVLLALIKAGLVFYYYMHIYHLNADDTAWTAIRLLIRLDRTGSGCGCSCFRTRSSSAG